MNLADLYRRQASSRPTAEAFRCADEGITWAQLDVRTDSVATSLTEGSSPGDRVAIVALNCHRYWETHVACAKSGLVTVPINPRLTVEEITMICADIRPYAVVVDERVLGPDDIAKVARAGGSTHVIGFSGTAPGSVPYEELTSSDDVATPPDRRHHVNVIGFTSGTTGRARGAILTHHGATTSALWFSSNLGLSSASTFLACMPAYVYRGQAGGVAPAITGARTIPLPFDADEVLTAIELHGVTHVILAPAMVDRLLAAPDLSARDLSTLQSVWIGGAPSSADMLRRFADVVPAVLGSTYGMTEATGIASTRWRLGHSPEEDRRELSVVGRPGPLLDVRLVAPDGSTVADGDVGEIAVRGDSMMAGYWGEEPGASFVEGWFHTGDMAIRHADGTISLVDRRADIIISGGLNVYAAEVERVLSEHPAVAACAVVGAPDETWGETVVAVVVVRPGMALELDEVRRHCEPHLARFKHPRRLRFVTELPTNAMGKIDKRALRADHWDDPGGASEEDDPTR